MGQTPRHSVSVAAVIVDEKDRHVLLIHRRDNGRWEPPGGVLELDESIEDGLRREVREETGVEIDIDGLAGVYKNMTHGIVALVYRCRATTTPLTETEEASEVAWQLVASVDALMPPAYAIRVHDALTADHATTRSHDGTAILSL